MGILNIVFLELILCRVFFSSEICNLQETCNFLQSLSFVLPLWCLITFHKLQKGANFITRYLQNAIFWNFEPFFLRIYFFTGCGIFLRVLFICLHLIKHVALGFNTFVAPPYFVVTTKLWKIFRKYKIVMLLTSVPFF